MGGLNPFSKPKMPQPVVVQPPSPTVAEDQGALTEERKRRALASGSTGNIVSSLATSTTDAQSATSRTKLLGG